ncbi:MAG: hypothetical protein QM729_05655 [Solirubrobacterales bacterium]
MRAIQAAACAVLLAGLAAAGPTGAADARAVAHASIGFEPTPLSLATDAAGHVFLSNPVSSTRIDEYSPDGALLASRGTFALSGGFDETRDIATDAAGDLWVADGEARKVVELGADGTVLRSWSAQGRGIAVSSAGDVYTAGPTEVARYSAAGTPISTWASPEGLGEAWGIAAGPEGLIYVADTYGDAVQVFEPDGTLVRAWAVGGSGGRPALPYGIAVSPSGNVYLAEAAIDRVAEFTAAGGFLRDWGGSGDEPGRFYTPTAVAVGPDGSVYVADTAVEYPNDGTARVQRFTADGRFLTEWGHVPRSSLLRPRITAGPAPRTTSVVAVIAFSSREKRASFRCRLTGHLVPRPLRRFRVCSSPRRYAHLRPGRKRFEVVAVVGGRESPAARRAWTQLPRS